MQPISTLLKVSKVTKKVSNSKIIDYPLKKTLQTVNGIPLFCCPILIIPYFNAYFLCAQRNSTPSGKNFGKRMVNLGHLPAYLTLSIFLKETLLDCISHPQGEPWLSVHQQVKKHPGYHSKGNLICTPMCRSIS